MSKKNIKFYGFLWCMFGKWILNLFFYFLIKLMNNSLLYIEFIIKNL